MLEIQNVTKYYHRGKESIKALSDFSLRLEPGEFVAVQGESGCGKTTLLLTAGGLLQPDQGTVILDDQHLYALSAEERARFRAENIGFVFQQFHLVPYLSVLENVLSASLALKRPNQKHRALDLLDELGLSHRLHHVPGELSTGERQRCALARALLNEPKVILADEPTGNLDERNARVVLQHLTELSKRGVAVMLVTHDSHAASQGGRIVRFNPEEGIQTAPTSSDGFTSNPTS